MNDYSLRHWVIGHIARQWLAHHPFFGLARRQAAVVLFRQARWATPRFKLIAVVIAYHDSLRVTEVAAHPYIISNLIASLVAVVIALVVPLTVTFFFLFLLAAFALARPFGFFCIHTACG